MVCEKCRILLIEGIAKQDKLSTPDVWRDGSRNTIGGKDGGQKIGVNKYLEKRKS